MMKWTLGQIRDAGETILPFKEELDLCEALKERKTDIIDVSPAVMEGYFFEREGAVFLHGQLNLDVTLPSTRSLEPVTLPLKIDIKERYTDHQENLDLEDFLETCLVVEDGVIDLVASAVDNLIVNLPTKVLGPGEEGQDLPSGQHWNLMTEDDYHRHQDEAKAEGDPRFAALKSLLEDNES